MRLGRGGSLLIELKLLQCGQKLRSTSSLFASDGKSELSAIEDK